ncbi:MAG: 50S ribosomal protein L30 [Acidimicrobiales bacterium]
MADRLRVVQVRSVIGTRPAHRATIAALGLGRIGASAVLPDRPDIRGMLAQVPHLVQVRVAPEGEVSK